MTITQLITSASITTGVCLTIDVGFRWILKRIIKRSPSKAWFRSLVLQSLLLPLSLYVWFLCLSFVICQLPLPFDSWFKPNIVAWRQLALILDLAFFGIRLTNLAQKKLIQLNHDQTTVDAISMLVRFSIIISTLLFLLQKLNFSLSGLLAFGGIGGIAIGFAARDMLANFFGAFMLYWDRPFKVGDLITSTDKNIEGNIEHIGWRLTTIRNMDKRPIYVPNSVFSTISLVNISRMSHRRIKEKIGLKFHDTEQVTQLTDAISHLLTHHPQIDETQTIVVNLDHLGGSWAEIMISAYTRTLIYKDFLDLKQEIMLRIVNLITAHDAQLAFLTTRVQFDDNKALASP